MVNKFQGFILLGVLCIFCPSALGQNIKEHYVARSMSGGTLYHTMPVTLFENSESGDITFDLTYKQGSKVVIMNFTYLMKQPTPADSVQFINGSTIISGLVEQLYIEPNQKQWKHRYTLSDRMDKFSPFFSNKEVVEAIIYSEGTAHRYKAKKSAWNGYAPIGYKIFEMIKLNNKL